MRQASGPIDRRLLARVSVARRYLVVAVTVGVAGAGAIIAQAVLLATVVSGSVLHHRPLSWATPALVGLGGAFVARALLVWVGEVAARRTSATVTSELRRRLLRQALALGPSWLAGERAGELSVTATRGVRALEAYFGRFLPQALVAAAVPVLVLAWVAAVDWPSALLLVALLGLIPPAMVFFGKRAQAETDRQWRRLASLAGRYLELIQGLATLRAFGRVQRGRQEVAAATDGLRRSTLSALKVGFLSALVLDLLAGLGVGLVAMVLGLRLLAGDLPLATALAVLLVAPEVFIPVRKAAAEFHASTEGTAAAGRILDILDTALPSPAGPPARSPAPDPRRGPLVFRSVSVVYPGRSRPALEGLDLEVVPGEHVVLSGPSGAGKSTVLSVLLGFVVPSGGTVSVDGSDLRSVSLEAWRAQLSWVPQRPFLFRGSLRQNLLLGDRGASEAALARALRLAALDDVVGELPDGLETAVGEAGLTLSVGERQRVAVARAVLRDGPLVLLDEPSAHLDDEDAARLAAGFDEWLEGRSVIMASHAPKTLRRIDRRLWLEEPAGAGGSVTAPAGVGGGS